MKRLLFIAMLAVTPLFAQEEDYGFKADDVDRSIFESDPVFESNYDGDVFKRGDNNGNGWGKGGNGNGNNGNGNGNGNSGDAPIDKGIAFVAGILLVYGVYRIYNNKIYNKKQTV